MDHWLHKFERNENFEDAKIIDITISKNEVAVTCKLKGEFQGLRGKNEKNKYK